MQTTLTVPGGVDMALVVGASDEILHVLEESFDARLTVRGDRIVIEGNAVEVQQLTALFADLFKTVEEGQAPDTDSVRRSVELLRQAEFAPAALRDDVLLTPHSGYYSDTSNYLVAKLSMDNALYYVNGEYDKVKSIRNGVNA